MSAITADTTEVAAPFDNETPTIKVRYDFKLTEENKTRRVNIRMNQELKDELTEIAIRSARWRSMGQLINDALIYYLNGDGDSHSPEEIIELSSWSRTPATSASVTQTLWEEIDLMVKHSHTPWNTKQEFYICALFTYIKAGFPVMEHR